MLNNLFQEEDDELNPNLFLIALRSSIRRLQVERRLVMIVHTGEFIFCFLFYHQLILIGGHYFTMIVEVDEGRLALSILDSIDRGRHIYFQFVNMLNSFYSQYLGIFTFFFFP